MLSDWGIAFEGVNVEGNPAGQAELDGLGSPGLPTVSVGARWVNGWQPDAYARLLGVAFDGLKMLSPDDLRRRLDRILEVTQDFVREAGDDLLAIKPPGRDRTVANLAFHVFRLSAAFVDCIEQNRFPGEWLQENAPPEMKGGRAIAEYGGKVRSRLRAWFALAPEEIYGGSVPTFYGEQSVHAVLERTTWHAGQHTRQVHHLLNGAGYLPPEAMDHALFEGLPLPREMW